MSKLFVLIGILMLASASARAGMFTNTGTASETCIWDGSGAPVPPDVSAISVTGTGASINLICPASFYGPSAGSYFGPGVSGSAGNLTAQGLIGEVPHVNATFSFQSNFTDSLTPVGGTGPGTVEFTVTYTWGGLEDIGAANDAADFSFNGAPSWSESAHVCNTPPLSNCPGGTTNTILKVIDEPVIYGTPFSYAADVAVTGSGNGVYGFNSLSISSALLTGGQLIEAPEPSSLSLCGVALLALFLRSYRLSRCLS